MLDTDNGRHSVRRQANGKLAIIKRLESQSAGKARLRVLIVFRFFGDRLTGSDLRKNQLGSKLIVLLTFSIGQAQTRCAGLFSTQNRKTLLERYIL